MVDECGRKCGGLSGGEGEKIWTEAGGGEVMGARGQHADEAK